MFQLSVNPETNYLGGSWVATLIFYEVEMPPRQHPQFSLVCCVSKLEVFERRLLASPCLQRGNLSLSAHFNCSSAAQAFNAALQGAKPKDWLVWVHQDVYLPDGWEDNFSLRLLEAQNTFNRLAVVGVYGLRGVAPHVIRAGHVLDRGLLLREQAPLPGLVDSLDELLFAVRVNSELKLDPELGFDFYATDLVLQAQKYGYQAAVVDAYCEHWSDTPAFGHIPATTQARIASSGSKFETKWAAQLPISTPCFDIRQTGDVQRAMAHFANLRQSE